jgi:L-lactate dehydrogenase complex protein LldE
MAFKEVYLFTTCLVDQVYPEIGAAVVRLLRKAGLRVVYPEKQVCCGQPFYNSGFSDEARKLAAQTISILEDAEAVVVPSGSCTTMLRHEYPKLFAGDQRWLPRAGALAGKTFELTEFLTDFTDLFTGQDKTECGVVTYHDSCHMNRFLGIKEPPRRLLRAAGYRIKEMEESDRCCGFGGVFYARMPEISGAMAKKKLTYAEESGASLVVTADPGCLMRMRQENGKSMNIRHIAEVLEEALR